MNMIEEMLQKANEEINKERLEDVQNKVRDYVDKIVRLESEITDRKNSVLELKEKLKKLEKPESLNVEI